MTRCVDDVDDIILDAFVDKDGFYIRCGSNDITSCCYGIDDDFLRGSHANEDLFFLFDGGIIDDDFEHETVELRLRECVSTVLIDGILSCNNEERSWKRVSGVADRDLFFLHSFEESGLNFSGCSVDFVGEDEGGEDGSFFSVEGTIILAISHGADDISGEEIRCELNSVELAGNDFSDGVAKESFSESRDTFEEDMTAGEQSDDGGIDHVFLSDDHARDFGFHGRDETGVLSDSVA